MKPFDINFDICIAFGTKNNEKGSQCKVGDHVRLSKL